VKELGKIITGKTPRTTVVENFGGMIPFLTPSDDMTVKYVRRTSRTLSRKGLAEVSNKILPANSIAVSCIGSDLGKVVMTTEDTVTNQQINSIIPKECYYPDYVYYAMKTLGAKLNFLSKTSTAVPIINKTEFSSEMILVPPLSSQKAIADTLSCLDAKMELNNKINENLEAQAQAIFKSWFVDFEPFQDGEFIESELGLIPEGWVVSSVKGVSKEVVTGKTPRTSDQENYGNHMMFITIPDMRDNVFIIQSERYLSKRGVATQPNKTLPANSILVSCIATAGLVSLTSEHSQTNQQINAIIPKEGISPYFLYSYMKTLSDHIINLGSGGTTTVNLNKGQFSNIKLIIPSPEVMERFHYSISPLFLKIKQNQRESTNLAILRDTLLPKLMSGEIEVPVD